MPGRPLAGEAGRRAHDAARAYALSAQAHDRSGRVHVEGMDGMTQFSFNGIGVSFGATTILRDVTFTVAAEKWGDRAKRVGEDDALSDAHRRAEPVDGRYRQDAELQAAVLDQAPRVCRGHHGVKLQWPMPSAT